MNGPLSERAQNRFELIPFDKIAFDTAPAYLIKGLIPRVGLCVFWGPPKCGKSFLVFDMLMHVALGWKYRGRRVQRGRKAPAKRTAPGEPTFHRRKRRS